MVDLRERVARAGERSTAYGEGRTLPFAKVAALALTLLEEVVQAPANRETECPPSQEAQRSLFQSGVPGSLSAREREALRLVARGLSNKAIVKQLVLAARTVAQHPTTTF